MSDKPIVTYLNDHLAGATAAIQLLEYLEAAHSGTPGDETGRLRTANPARRGATPPDGEGALGNR